MRVAIHLMRDASEPGRLVGATHVWGYDTATRGPFASYEELPHTIDVYEKRFSNARFASLASSLDELIENTARWARTITTDDPDRAERVARFLRSPESYFELALDETPEAFRYTFTLPNLRADQLRGLGLTNDPRSSQKSARHLIAPYSILEPWSGDRNRRREHRVIGRLDAQGITQLPTAAFDIEVMNWKRVRIDEDTRDALLDRIERDAVEAGIGFSADHYKDMDVGLVRKHAHHLGNLIRDERIYDVVVRTPTGSYVSITSLPVPNPTIVMPFGIASVISCSDQDGIAEEFTRIMRTNAAAIVTGHNITSYDQRAFERLGAPIVIGADGTSAKTRFAVAGSTIEKRILPDGRVIEEPHDAFLADRGWRGIDTIDPRPWLGFVDELVNTKLATVTRALTGRAVEKSLDHDELERIAQAITKAQEEPHYAERIMREADLGSLDEVVERERRYALSDVWFSTLNAERITPTLARIARSFDATLSEICTTSPESHGQRAWNPRGATTQRAIRDAAYRGIDDRHRFTAEKAFERLTPTTRVSGAHDVILARRTSGRLAAEAIDHPVLASLIAAYDSTSGFDRSWVERYIDAMLTEPLYALLASGTSEIERDANAWMLGLHRSHLQRLETVLDRIPAMRTIASSPKHLYFAKNDAAQVESLARDGWIEPLEEGHAISFARSVIYRGSRTMTSGYADPLSQRGLRNAFTATWLPRIVEQTLERDYEGALRTIREAYSAFSQDDAIIEKTLGKDASDYNANAKSTIIDEALRIDARKGDTVFVRIPSDEYRSTLFGPGTGEGLFIDPLFAALGATRDPAFTFGYSRFLNGDDDALRTLLPSSRSTPLMLL